MNKVGEVIPHRNIEIKKPPRMFERASSDPEMLFQFRAFPITDAMLEHLTVKLIDWARNNKEALTLDSFLAENNLIWETVKKWRDRYERLDHAWKFAKVCLSARREVGALKGTLNSAVVLKTMPIYSQEWKELLRWYE